MLALEVRHLSKTYANGKTALDDVSLGIPTGSFYALLGPNGAGKSTLINILADTVRPDAGMIRFLDHDLFAERSWCKRRMGIVPQEIAFDPFFTPREVLEITSGLYGVPPDKIWIDELMQRFELTEQSHRLTRQLSGGMRRRLLVAQALVHKPEFVILDEPTAGVDVELRRRLWDFMRELNDGGTTILLTTHYLEEAEELCEYVAIIDQGRLLTEKPMVELIHEVAGSYLWLSYQTPPVLDDRAGEKLKEFQPCLVQDKLCLKLSGRELGRSFHAAYDAAVQQFGIPQDVGIRQEDLEDVFLRLTGERQG